MTTLERSISIIGVPDFDLARYTAAFEQDESGVWAAPTGDRIALTQFVA